MPPFGKKKKKKGAKKAVGKPPTPPPIATPTKTDDTPTPSEGVYSCQLSLQCLYCSDIVVFNGLPATKYILHLRQKHSIEYDHDAIVNRTVEKRFPLKLQIKKLAVDPANVKCNKSGTSEASVQTEVVEAPATPVKVKAVVVRLEKPIEEEKSPSPTPEPPAEEPPIILVKESRPLPWCAGCEYRCQICSELFFLVEDLLKHIKTEHKIPSDDYVDKYGKLETKVVYIECKICLQKLKRNYKSVSNHLWLEHEQMLCDTYRIKYEMKDRVLEVEVPMKKKLPVEEEEVKVEKKVRPGPKCSKRKREAEPPSENGSGQAKVPRLEVVQPALWHQGVEYQCRVCNELLFWEREALLVHTKAVHGLDRDGYYKRFRHISSKTVKYKCEICSEQVIHAKFNIERHLQREHNMEIDLYADLFHSGAAEEKLKEEKPKKTEIPEAAATARPNSRQDVVVMSDSSQSDDEWKADGVEPEDDDDDEEEEGAEVSRLSELDSASEDELQKIVVSDEEDSDIVSEEEDTYNSSRLSPETPNSIEPPTLSPEKEKPSTSRPVSVDPPEARTETPEEEITYTLEAFLEGGCEFNCPLCDTMVKSSTVFWEHVETTHGLSQDSFKDKHDPKTYLTKSVKIECAHCYKVVRHEPGAWGQHCSKVHGMELVPFYRKYYDQSAMAAGAEDRLNEQPQSQEQGQTFEEWWNQSIFECPLPMCGKKLHGGFTKHLIGTHQMTELEYLATRDRLPVPSAMFKCRECKKSFKFSGHSIHRHLYAHLLTPRLYFKIYHQDQSQQLRQWQLGCEYDCRICDKKMQDYGILQNHLRLAHKMSVEDYKRDFGDMMSKRVEGQCEICLKSIVWYPWAIEKHVKAHGYSVSKYYYLKVKKEVQAKELDPVYGKSSEKGSGYKEGEAMKCFKKWKLSGCRYDCKIPKCGKISLTSSGIQKHIIRIHETSIIDYEAQFGSFKTRVREMQCVICTQTVKMSMIALAVHIKKGHKIELSEYFDSHVAGREWRLGHSYNEASISPALATSSTPCSSAIHYPPMQAFNTVNRIHVDENFRQYNVANVDPQTKLAYLSWRDQCRYQCKICDKTYSTYMGMYSHCNNRHKISMTEYRNKHGSELVKEVKKACPVCQRVIRHETGSWKDHAKTHSSDPFSIFINFVLHKRAEEQEPSSDCSFDGLQNRYLQCKSCTHVDTINSHQAMLEHVSQNHGENSSYEERFILHQCRICYSDVQQRKEHMEKHLKQHIIELEQYLTGYVSLRTDRRKEIQDPEDALNSWMNSGKPFCKICNSNHVDIEELRKHLGFSHRLSLDDYISLHGELEIYQEFSCHICQENVMRAPETIVLHLADSTHDNMTPDQYYEKYYVVPAPKQYLNCWEEACSYVCCHCQVYSDNYVFMRHHHLTAHKLAGNKLKDSLARALAKKTTHRCGICKTSITRNSLSIREHLKEQHGTNIREYFNKYAFKKRIPSPRSEEPLEQRWMQGCLLTCNVCFIALPSKRSFTKHLLEDHPESSLDIGNSLTGSRVFTCKICIRSYDHDPEDITRHLQESHATSPEDYKKTHITGPQLGQVYPASFRQTPTSTAKRSCQFKWNKNPVKCYLCPATSTSLNGLAQHMSNVHKTGMRGQNVQMVGQQLLHRCLLCSALVKMETKDIIAHIMTKHKMSIYDYEDRFKADLQVEFENLENDVGTPSNFVNSVLDTGASSSYNYDEDEPIEFDMNHALTSDIGEIAVIDDDTMSIPEAVRDVKHEEFMVVA